MTRRRLSLVAALVAAVAALVAVSPAGASTLLARHCSHWKYFGHRERTHTCVSIRRKRGRHIVGHAWSGVYVETTSPYPQWHVERTRRVDMCGNFVMGHETSLLPCTNGRGLAGLEWHDRCRRGARMVHMGAGGTVGRRERHATRAALDYRCKLH